MPVSIKNYPLPLPVSIVITDKTLIDKIFIILNAYGFSWGPGRNIDHYLTFRTINAIYLLDSKRLMYTSGEHQNEKGYEEYTDIKFLELNL